MTSTPTPSEQITDEVTSWPGVTAGPGRRGEFAFRVGRREIGHLHGDHAAHFSFPRDVWADLSDQGRIGEHPVFPGKVGPAARRITAGNFFSRAAVSRRFSVSTRILPVSPAGSVRLVSRTNDPSVCP